MSQNHVIQPKSRFKTDNSIRIVLRKFRVYLKCTFERDIKKQGILFIPRSLPLNGNGLDTNVY
jgi:hypothetical protein